MNCNAARGRFSAHLDKDLTFEEEALLREHLAQCRVCEQELVAMERMLAVLHNLPQVAPGSDFLAGVQQRIATTEDREPSRAARSSSLQNLWRPWFRVPVLRPALAGVALGMLCGILLATQTPQLAGLWGRQGAQGVTAGQPAAERTAPAPVVPNMVSSESSTGPWSDVDLSRADALSDTALLGGEPEYVLEPYVTDPQRGLVPADPGDGRTVGADMGDQSDVFIAF